MVSAICLGLLRGYWWFGFGMVLLVWLVFLPGGVCLCVGCAFCCRFVVSVLFELLRGSCVMVVYGGVFWLTDFCGLLLRGF